MLEVVTSLRTPRPHTPGKGIGTLIGNGWLRESPRNRVPPAFRDIRSKSALRKCLVLPVPSELLRDLPPNAFGTARPAAPPIVAAPPVPLPAPKPRDPRRDVRAMPAMDPAAMQRVAHAKALADAYADVRRAARAPAKKASSSSGTWDAPVKLGSLLLLAPPVGIAVLWASRRYSGDARWALTIMTALGMCLASAVAITALAIVR